MHTSQTFAAMRYLLNHAHSSLAGVHSTRRCAALGPWGLRAWLLLWLILPLSLVAQQLRVQIVDDAATPQPYAAVRVTSLGQPCSQWQYADSTGTCTFACQPPVRVEVQLLGFVPLTDTLLSIGRHTLQLTGSGLQTEAVVVTAQKEALPASLAPLSIRVMDETRIRDQAAPNLATLLTHELNIRLQQDAVLGTSLSLQGLNGQNVKILVDGVPVVGRLNGQLDLTQLNLADVERVEIVEGPMAVNFGADALGGVINLITRRGSQARKWSGGVNSLYESMGTYNADGWLAYAKGPHRLRLATGRNFFDGWQANGRVLQWKPREQWHGSLAYSWEHKTHRISYRGSYFHETLISKGQPVVTPLQAYAFDDRFQTRRLQQDLNWRYRPSAHHQVEVLAAGSLFARTHLRQRTDLLTLAARTLEGDDAPDTNRFDLWMSRGTWTYTPSKAWEISTGYEANHETSAGDRIANSSAQQWETAAFAVALWKPGARWQLRPGLRATHHSEYAAPLMPSFNVGYRFSPRVQLRGAWAMGFRAPSLRERYLFFVDINHNIQGNPDLLAETSQNTQLLLQYQHLTQRTGYEAEVGLFYNNVHDLITLAVVNPQTALYSYVNIGQLQTAGLRVQSKVLRPAYTLQVGAILTALGAPEWRAQGSDDWYYSPEVHLSARVKLPWYRLRLGTFGKYTGRLLTPFVNEDSSLSLQFIEDFITWDLTLSRQFAKERLTLLVGGRNLLNVTNLQANMRTGAHSGGGSSLPQATGRLLISQLNFAF